MKQECVFKAESDGIRCKVMREPMDYVVGGYVYRLYSGRKMVVKEIWTSKESCIMMALKYVLGYQVERQRL